MDQKLSSPKIQVTENGKAHPCIKIMDETAESLVVRYLFSGNLLDQHGETAQRWMEHLEACMTKNEWTTSDYRIAYERILRLTGLGQIRLH